MDIKYLRMLWLDKKIKELKEKIRLKKLGCIVLAVLLSGCIPRGVPIEIFTRADQKVLKQMELDREQRDRLAKQPKKPEEVKIVRKKKIISAKDTIIKAIIIEFGFSISEAIVLWKDYKKSGTRGLAAYLIDTNYFEKIYGKGIRDDLYIRLVTLIVARTKVIKRESGWYYGKTTGK